MPRLVISQKAFIEILKQYNFYPDRTVGSHQTWKGFVDGRNRSVQVDLHYKEYSGAVLNSMIRQSGIPKEIFRR